MEKCMLINNHSTQSWPCSFHANYPMASLYPNGKKHHRTTRFTLAKFPKQNKSPLHSVIGKNFTIQRRRSSSETPTSSMVTQNEDPKMGSSADMDCIGTGLDVECVISNVTDDDDFKGENLLPLSSSIEKSEKQEFDGMVNVILDTLLLISPFFFWGTAMVAMKEVLPKTGSFFVAAVRLIPSGLLLIGFAQYSGKKQPAGFMSWLAVALFGLVDAACFQGFLAEGLKRTSAGLGSVIIDSQPLTVAILAAILFGESIGRVGVAGLVLGVIGLLLLEVPTLNGIDFSETMAFQNAVFEQNFSSLWGSGEWWMLLAAQSMAVGTVMVRWVCKYSDPVMATGWHMIIGGLPLLALSVIQHDPALNGSIQELELSDWLALTYTSIFGSAISYGVYFYNATRGLWKSKIFDSVLSS
ncbi:WAT1-related protein At3g02690, chloroplastic isoform X2 [Cryptomeria japonica]|uniref:WAT1-related protein At3g02690, chloroplastic isoform X2 n=1 Tax=Cryptomeria japonica TaxID=3369 RepID=UPI0025ACAFB7|nr:WAT1-related protein At3g02690, chloroplastic isoform X2 [Cryptomeria japonica]